MRVVVEGEPGSGKTTFMKAVCRAWVSVIQQKSTSHVQENGNTGIPTESEHFSADSVLLAFILRHVTEEHSLFDLIKSQFAFLTCPEVSSLLSYVQSHPENVYLFFDGFDEFKLLHEKQILDLISGKEKGEVLRIITTRSYGIIQLKRHRSEAIQALVKLCGFSQEQIKKYIDLYFDLKPEVASEMKNNITQASLWKLASVPIRLQMMCFVWKVYQKLGKNMAQLYKMLLMALLDHMEKRDERAEHKLALTEEKDIMTKYHESILLPIAKLAYRWDEHGNLKIQFPFSDIKRITGENFENIIHFGCITKYYSSFTMQQQVWNFSHLSLQEYFVAYNIVHSQPDLKEFANICKHIHALERNRMILEFLCAMAPEKSNEILTAVITEDRTEIEHVQILNNVFVLMKAYENLSLVDIPLPRSVVLGNKDKFPGYSVDFDTKLTYLSHLFTKDRESHKNMAILKVNELEQLPTEVKTDYIKGLVVTVREKEQLNRINTLLSHLSDEASILDLDFVDNNVTQPDISKLLGRLQARNIITFCIKGIGVIEMASEILKQQPKLRLLTVNDTCTNPTSESGEHVKSMCLEANKCQHLKELKLYGNILDSSLTTLSKDIKVTVHSKHSDMEKFITVSKDVASTASNITGVDLSFSNLSNERSQPGELIGQILIYLTTLLSLKLRCCGLTTKAVYQLKKKILSSKLGMKELDLLGNRLDSCDDLQGILDRCPDLNVLLMTFVNESKIPERIGKIKVIVATGTKKCTTVLKVTRCINRLHKLYIIHAFPDFSEFKISSVACQLKILYILDAPTQNKALAELSENVKYMKNLEELHFASMYSQKLEEFKIVLSLLTNLPSSVTHLDLYGYDSDELTHILQKKHQMENLLKLNIGSVKTSPDTIQIIRQELQEINQKVEVYCDKEECLMSLISYSTVNPPSTITIQSMQEAYDMLEALS